MGDLLIRQDAVLSEDGKYRYRLSRHWGNGPEVTFIMLNPSTADAFIDDPTIRKCMGFSRRWNMSGLYVGNLFAVRATKPEDMRASSDPVGPDNRDHLESMCKHAFRNGGLVVCAWGAHGSYRQQDKTFLGWMDVIGVQAKCLRLTKDGAPGHPLYVPYEAALSDYGRR
jgi:hypothetical protein